MPASGFSFTHSKDGQVRLMHRGRLARTLKGSEAQRFLALSEHADESTLQRRMAALTGQYKFGNERSKARR